MPRFDYRIAANWNVALVSLTNPENRSEFVVAGNAVPPTSDVLNLYPFRRVALSGQEKGYGRVDHVWTWSVLPRAAVAWLEALLFSSAIASACTIYTRLHTSATYVRYNAYATLWVPGTHFEYLRAPGSYYANVQLRFRGLFLAT